MQVFVLRSDLLLDPATTKVRVMAAYPDTPAKPIDFNGSQCTVLIVNDNQVDWFRPDVAGGSPPPPSGMGIAPTITQVLVPNWRNEYRYVLNNEAFRRIQLVFPEFKQRNYTAKYQDNITQYGTDTSTWPSEQQTFKAEYDRGWKYVSDVRTASNAWTAMPADPTADSIWPTQISPIA